MTEIFSMVVSKEGEYFRATIKYANDKGHTIACDQVIDPFEAAHAYGTDGPGLAVRRAVLRILPGLPDSIANILRDTGRLAGSFRNYVERVEGGAA